MWVWLRFQCYSPSWLLAYFCMQVSEVIMFEEDEETMEEREVDEVNQQA